MKRFFKTLTRRQKVALAGMAAANILTLILALMVVRGARSATAFVPSAPDCGEMAALLLARQDMAGSAAIGAGSTLRLTLTGLDVQGQPLPQATDAAWEALSAMLALPQLGCGPFEFIQVDLPAPEGHFPGTRLVVRADWMDWRAWGYGELDDGALAARLQTTLYTPPSR